MAVREYVLPKYFINPFEIYSLIPRTKKCAYVLI